MRKTPNSLPVFSIVLLLAAAVIFPATVGTAAPIKPFNRWGNSLVDSTPEAGNALSAWIDGVKYGFYVTTADANNTDIYTNGTDWNPSGINKCKSGGEDGDKIIYRLVRTGTDKLIANEIDTFAEGGSANADLNFTSGQDKEINKLKIYRIYVNPSAGNNIVSVKNTGSTIITVSSNWKIKADGTVPGDYEAWQMALPNGGISPGSVLDIDIGTGNITASNGDIELSWKDPVGTIAHGEWVVMDRAEWTSSLMAHDGSPGNTTMTDKTAVIPAGYHLERKIGGTQDTDNCEADFAIVPDSSSAALSLNVTAPVTGNAWKQGTAHSINWTVFGSSTYAAFINISDDGGATFGYLGKQDFSLGNYTWAIPAMQPVGTNYMVKVEVVDLANLSITASNFSGVFSIVEGGGGSIAYVSISPPSPLLIYVNVNQPFAAQAYDNSGNPISSGVTYLWQVTGGAGSVAPITGSSVTFTAAVSAGTGSVNVTASMTGGNAANFTLVEVTSAKPVLDHVDLSPAGPLQMNAGEKVMFNVSGKTSDNKNIGGVVFAWSLAPSALGTLSTNTGSPAIFTAGSLASEMNGSVFVNGTYNSATKGNSADITVKAGAQIDRITVTPAQYTFQIGDFHNFTAVAYDSGNQTIPGVTFVWSVQPSSLGNITGAGSTVKFTSVSLGSGKLRANAMGTALYGEASINVSQYPPWKLGSLKIDPKSALNMTIGSIETFTVTAYADGNSTIIPSSILAGLYKWSISPSGIGTISSSNETCTFEPKADGSGKIIVAVTYNNVTVNANATISVQPKSSGFGDFMWIVVGIIAVIVVIALVALLLSRKKRKPLTPAPTGETAGNGKEEPTSEKKEEPAKKETPTEKGEGAKKPDDKEGSGSGTSDAQASREPDGLKKPEYTKNDDTVV
jgi:hypothetical protein